MRFNTHKSKKGPVVKTIVFTTGPFGLVFIHGNVDLTMFLIQNNDEKKV